MYPRICYFLDEEPFEFERLIASDDEIEEEEVEEDENFTTDDDEQNSSYRIIPNDK